VISVRIQPQTNLATINVQFDDAASADDLRSAWEEVLSGALQRHMRDAIWFECAKRKLNPDEIVTDPPELN
jgi:hypothetical protein